MFCVSGRRVPGKIRTIGDRRFQIPAIQATKIAKGPAGGAGPSSRLGGLGWGPETRGGTIREKLPKARSLEIGPGGLGG